MTYLALQRKTIYLLCGITILGGILRFWGIDFGLPHTECRPDEPRIVHIAFSFFRGSLHPHFFDYPTLYMYLLFIVYSLYYGLGTLLGQFKELQDFINLFFINPETFYLINRWLSALLGTATIPLVYALARQLYGRKSALLGAFFMSVAYLHVRDSHFGVTDVPMTFFITLSVMYILKCQSISNRKTYLLAGIFTGLATATKYNGAILITPMLLAHAIVLQKEKRLSLMKMVDRRIILFVLASAGTFVLASPFIVLDLNAFLSAFLREMNHLKQGHWDIILERGWWYHARYTLRYGLGPAMLAASLGGLIFGLRRNWRPVFILAAFPLIYYFIAGRGYTVFLRYMIPVIPFICIFAADFTVSCSDAIWHRCPRLPRSGILAIIAILIVWQPVYHIYHLNTLLNKTDNRIIATEWIEANVQPGNTIYQSFWPRLMLETPTTRIYPVTKTLERKFRQRIARGREALIKQAKQKYLDSKNTPGFWDWQFDRKSKRFTNDQMELRGVPDYIITSSLPLTKFSFPPPEPIQKLLQESYELQKSFIAVDANKAVSSWYDQIDAFYVPFAGFAGVLRPGPNIYIYKKK